MSSSAPPPAPSEGIFADGAAAQHVYGAPALSIYSTDTTLAADSIAPSDSITINAPSPSPSRSPTPTLRVMNPSPSPSPSPAATRVRAMEQSPLATLFPSLLGGREISASAMAMLKQTSWIIDPITKDLHEPQGHHPPPFNIGDSPGHRHRSSAPTHGRSKSSEIIPQIGFIILLVPSTEQKAPLPMGLRQLLVEKYKKNGILRIPFPPLHEQILTSARMCKVAADISNLLNQPLSPNPDNHNIYRELNWPRVSCVSLIVIRGLRGQVLSYTSLLSCASTCLVPSGVVEIQELDWASLKLTGPKASKAGGGATARFVHFCKEADAEENKGEGLSEIPACMLVANIIDVASERIPIAIIPTNPTFIAVMQAFELELSRGRDSIVAKLGGEETDKLVWEVREEVESGIAVVDAVIIRGRKRSGRVGDGEDQYYRTWEQPGPGVLERLFGRKKKERGGYGHHTATRGR